MFSILHSINRQLQPRGEVRLGEATFASTKVTKDKTEETKNDVVVGGRRTVSLPGLASWAVTVRYERTVRLEKKWAINRKHKWLNTNKNFKENLSLFA